MARKGTLTKAINLPDGTRKWVYAKTKEELQQKLLDYQIQIGMGIDLNNHDTFGEYAQMWYKTYKEPRLRTASKNAILNALNNHILPVLSGYKMKDITPMHIQVVFNSIAGMSESLVNKVRIVLNAIFNSAAENNIILKSPMSKSLNITSRKTPEKEVLSEEQVTNLLSALGSGRDGAKRCWLFCLVALQTGLRRGELCGLMWNDIDFQKAELTVSHNCSWSSDSKPQITTDLKTAAAHRIVPLPNAALAALKEERKTSNSLYVFHRISGQPHSQSSLKKMWRYAEKVDVNFSSLTPHILRHTYCTRLFEKGFDPKEVQYLMGHSTPEMTLRVYTHYNKKARFSDTANRIRAAL